MPSLYILWFAFISAALLGWVANIYKLATTSPAFLSDWGVMEVFRVIGIFAAPLGSILGFL